MDWILFNPKEGTATTKKDFLGTIGLGLIFPV